MVIIEAYREFTCGFDDDGGYPPEFLAQALGLGFTEITYRVEFLEPAGQRKAHSGEGYPYGISVEISEGKMIETTGFEIGDSLLDDAYDLS